MKKTKILIPNVQKYTLKYRKSNGKTENYIVTLIEKKEKGMTCYAFGKGIRTFNFDRILAID